MAFYLFPGTMYKRLQYVHYKIHDDSEIDADLRHSYTIYQICTRKYLGLGFLLQFWPGTEAKRARGQLLENLEFSIDILKKEIEAIPLWEEQKVYGEDYHLFVGFIKYSCYSSIYSWLTLTPIFDMLQNMTIVFMLIVVEIKKNHKRSSAEIVSTFPIIQDFFPNYLGQEKVAETWSDFLLQGLLNLLHSIFNPFRIIHTTLTFAREVLVRIFDIGSTEGQNSSNLRWFLKAIVGLVFGICAVPVQILMGVVDLVYSIPMAFLVAPILHFANSLYDGFVIGNQTFIATVEEMRGVAALRFVTKRQTSSYTKVAKNPKDEEKTKYLTLDKEKIYDVGDNAQTFTLIAIQSSTKDKVYKLYQLLAIHGSYKRKNRHDCEYDICDDKNAIDEARTVIFRK